MFFKSSELFWTHRGQSQLSDVLNRACLKSQSMSMLRFKSRMDTWYIYHDNAPDHHAKTCNEYLTITELKLLQHPPYGPSIATCNFALSSTVKMKLEGIWFSSDEDLPTTGTMSVPQSQMKLVRAGLKIGFIG